MNYTRYFIYSACLVLAGCLPHKNIEGQPRFDKADFLHNPKKCASYTTNILENRLYINIIEDPAIKKLIPEGFQNGLVFYPDNKVGFFKDYYLDEMDVIDAKKGVMGFSCFKENKFTITRLIETPSLIISNHVISEITLIKEKSLGDTLYFSSPNTSTGSAWIRKFVLADKSAQNVSYLPPDW